MKQTYRRLLPTLAAVALVGYFVVWPRVRDRDGRHPAVDALTADLDAACDGMERAIAAVPDPPTPADAERLALLDRKNRELIERMRDVPPDLKGESARRYLEAAERFQLQMLQLGEKRKEVREQLDPKKRGKAI